MYKPVTAFVFGLVTAVAAGAPASAAESARIWEPPSITVNGHARMFVKPDVAYINMGVVSAAPSAVAALSANSQKMSTLMETLSKLGVAEKDVQTSNFSIEPQYGNSSSGHAPKILSYQVSNSVTIRQHKIEQVGPLLDALVGDGANQVNNVSLTVDETSQLLDTIRKQAIEDARRKAKLYADAGGVQLGKVLYISEASAMHEPIAFGARRMMAPMGMAATTPISAGESELSLDATVVFAIE